MMATADAKEWVSQARKGILELCVLTAFSRKACYGYELIPYLSKWEQLAATKGTVYPMLRRLEKSGYISAEWQVSDSRPPRKYYQLTDTGQRLLLALSSEWTGLTRAVAQLQETRVDPAGANSTQAQPSPVAAG
jgi:PadR family transcriptional regulator PadR